jgi:hypothetical protein
VTEPAASNIDVFINCPFDDDYQPTFEALIFAIFACGFRPRSALELDDGSQTRIDKLYAIIEQCRYGVHDLCRTEVDKKTRLPRFNMPLELGLFLGAKRFGDDAQRQKRCLVLDVERYRYQKFISDLAGVDIKEHGGSPDQAIERTRNWLGNVSRRKLPAASLIHKLHAKFLAEKPEIAERLGFDPAKIPYVDFETIVTEWLVAAPSTDG